jgi:hypothetical protein
MGAGVNRARCRSGAHGGDGDALNLVNAAVKGVDCAARLVNVAIKISVDQTTIFAQDVGNGV